MHRVVVVASVLAALGAPSAAQPSEADDPDDLDDLDEIDPTAGGKKFFTLSKGFIASETRSYVRQRDDDVGNNEQLLAELRLEVDLNFGSRITGYVRPWFLIDALDTDLRRYEPLDAYVTYKRENWDIKLGQFVESWGMADTFNPVDVLNRRDSATDFVNPVVLGELAAKLRIAGRLGETIEEISVSLYFAPLWRETPFPTVSSRFQIALNMVAVRPDLTVRPAFKDAFFSAIRVEHTLRTGLANADLQYVVARGPDRQPVFVILPELSPQYHGSWVFGAGFRAVPNASGWSTLSFKGEIAYRRTYSLPTVEAKLPVGLAIATPYTQYAVGLERSFHEVFGAKDQLTAIVEYIGEFGADESDPIKPFRPFGSDVAFALRWAANDFSRTSIDGRVIVDVTSGELIGELILARQLRFLHDDLRLSLSGRILRPKGNSVLAFFPNNSSVTTRLQFDF